jgi:hypothetical protein
MKAPTIEPPVAAETTIVPGNRQEKVYSKYIKITIILIKRVYPRIRGRRKGGAGVFSSFTVVGGCRKPLRALRRLRAVPAGLMKRGEKKKYT